MKARLYWAPALTAIAGAWLSSLPLLSAAPPFSFFDELNAQGSGAFVLFAQSAIALCWRILGILVPIAATTRAAADDHRAGAFARGFTIVFLLLLIGIVAVILIVPTFGISIVAYLAFFLYALPASILGGAKGPDAIVQSLSVASAKLRPSLAIAALLIAAGIAGGLIGGYVVPTRFGSNLFAWAVLEAVIPYATARLTSGYLAAAQSQASTS